MYIRTSERSTPGSLFQRIQNALASGQWYLALSLTVLSGDRDVNRLANMIFFAWRPELKGRKLAPTDPNFKPLSREWVQIRDTIVRPFLAKTASAKPPASSGPEAKPRPAPYCSAKSGRARIKLRSASACHCASGAGGNVIELEDKL